MGDNKRSSNYMKRSSRFMTVNDVSRITGVSVRTLHYYDEIGLLGPDAVSDAGYRLYGESALARLHSIMLFRELKFPLKEIKKILDSPGFDEAEALQQQIKLLELQRQRIDDLICLAHEVLSEKENKVNEYKKEISGINIAGKGINIAGKDINEDDTQKHKGDLMNKFKAFDKTEIEKYEEEVRQRWGDTQAYQEYQQKVKKAVISSEQSAGSTDKKFSSPAGSTDKKISSPAGSVDKKFPQAAGEQLMLLFAEIGSLRIAGLQADDAKIQKKIAGIQAFITANFYTCTDEILAGLGEMYAADERFRKNIDKAGGEGTAEFVRDAIRVYCSKKLNRK